MKLLDFNFSTSTFKSSLEGFGCSLVNTFLNICRSSVNEVFCFLKAKAAVFLHSLNYLKFGSTSALQNNIKRCLFFSSSLATTNWTSGNSNGCGCGFNTILILQDGLKFTNFFHCQIYQFFSNSFNICHFFNFFNGYLFFS